jgi:hypothetical protein
MQVRPVEMFRSGLGIISALLSRVDFSTSSLFCETIRTRSGEENYGFEEKKRPVSSFSSLG